MKPRELPLEARATPWDVLLGRGSIVGARTWIGRELLDLPKGMISPYEVSAAVGLDYGDPPLEEARYIRDRTAAKELALLGRWFAQRVLPRPDRGTAEQTIHVAPVTFHSMRTHAVVERIMGALSEGTAMTVYFVHPHAVNQARKDPELVKILEEGDLVLPDGIGLQLAASLLGQAFLSNANGTDLVPELLRELAVAGLPVALLGGAKGVALEAATQWRTHYGVTIRDVMDGFQDAKTYEAWVKGVQKGGPVVVLVGMGTPLQERFVHRHLKGRPGLVAVTVGGLFDFASGRKRRAPLALRQLGLEWVFRLALEPRRMASRYLKGNPEFLYAVGRQRMGAGKGARRANEADDDGASK